VCARARGKVFGIVNICEYFLPDFEILPSDFLRFRLARTEIFRIFAAFNKYIGEVGSSAEDGGAFFMLDNFLV